MRSKRVRMKAEWALWSKQAGEQIDYRVIASSGGRITDAEYTQLIRRHLPGNPPSVNRPGPGQLPWVTFSPARTAGGHGVAVAVLDILDTSDRDGRRIAPTRYLWFRFDELADARVGYCSLAAEALRLQLPASGGNPLIVDLEPVDTAELSRRIDDVGFGRVATATSQLLDAPLAVTDAGDAALDDRVAWLDVLVALLPFGIRGDLSASTWATSAGRGIRLTFASSARPGQHATSLRDGAASSVDDPMARAYLDALSTLQARHGTVKLVSFLADQASLLTFDDRRAALESLRALDYPLLVAVDARAGRATAEHVRDVLHGDHGNASPEDASTLTAWLLTFGDVRDVSLVERHWSADLGPTLLAKVEKAIAADVSGASTAPYLELATAVGCADQLLVDLMDRAGAPGAGAPPRSARDGVVSAAMNAITLPDDAAGAAHRWPRFRERMVAQPEAVFRVLARWATEEDLPRFSRLLRWLEAGDAAGRRLARLFLPAISRRFDGDAFIESVARLEAIDARYLAVPMSAALAAHGPDPVVDSLWKFVLSGGTRVSEESGQAWQDALAHLWPACGGAPDSLVRLDHLILHLGGEPPPPGARRLGDSAITVDAYARALVDLYDAEPTTPGWAALIERYRAFLLGRRWTGRDRALVDELIEALIALDPIHWKPAATMAEPGPLGRHADGPGFADSASTRPGVEVDRALAAIGPHTPIESAAESCRDLLLDADRRIAVLSELRRREYLTDPDRLDAFLWNVRQAMKRAGESEDRAWEIHGAVIHLAIGGVLGDRVARAYRTRRVRPPHPILDLFDGVGDALDTAGTRLRQLAARRRQRPR